jgi:hypothetical protein
MSEVVAVLSVACLAVVFGMLFRQRGGCPGPEACDKGDEPGCCSLPSESNHVRN